MRLRASPGPASCALLLALAGCATGSGVPHAPDSPVVARERAAAALDADAYDALGRAAIGSIVDLPAAGDPAGQVRVIESYSAGSGLPCKRVNVLDSGKRRVLCRRASGHWTPTRALEASIGSTDVPVVAAALPNGQPGPARAARKAVQPGVDAAAGRIETLGAGETLWAFARRTSGRGSDWQAIADANDITDPAVVRAGTRLFVPQSLDSATASRSDPSIR